MLRFMLKSKVHRATVTDANVNYEGSITLDEDLMDAANLLPFEQVHLLDVTNGSRLETYVIKGERKSGTVCVNGAAAHLIKKNDTIIIASYVMVKEKSVLGHKPLLVYVNEKNRITKIS